jgi:outer membrane protein OmpA-like peptidoglycan-associated protein
MGSAPRPSQDPSKVSPFMADTPKSRSANEPGEEFSSNDTRSYEELRHLILAPEQQALERLHDRISDPESRTEDVSGVVAEAIQRRRDQGGSDALSDALAPTIETALRESVRKDPGTLADALFPVMGPAIRRSILETLRSFLDSFNQILDQSLSVQGLKWRIEALRTGRSFTEVALLHSLVFRVEQVFLIHKKTGLPIAHAVAPAVAMEDPSLVSGMLSAIQDFVRDSFHAGPGQAVNRMNVGDLDVWVEDGPYAILAAVIRGVAPRSFRQQMQETLEKIHAEYSAKLDAYDGDSAPFVDVQKDLAACLDSKFKQETQSSGGYGYALVAAAVLVALIGGWLGWRWWQFHRWEQMTETLGSQPGLTVTSFGRDHGKFVIRGLRDPLAADPSQIMANAGLDPARAEFHWSAYYALDDALVQKRAVAALAPPSEVSLVVKDGVLRVEGSPTAKWLADVRSRGLLIPGIRALDLGQFTPEQLAFNEVKAQLQAVVIRFPLDSSELTAGERVNLRNVMPAFRELLNAPVSARAILRIEVVGHSDTSGGETLNENLSQKRADRIATQLVQFGVPITTIHAKGVATAEPVRPEDSEENRQYNRSATFRIIASATSQP